MQCTLDSMRNMQERSGEKKRRDLLGKLQHGERGSSWKSLL